MQCFDKMEGWVKKNDKDGRVNEDNSLSFSKNALYNKILNY